LPTIDSCSRSAPCTKHTHPHTHTTDFDFCFGEEEEEGEREEGKSKPSSEPSDFALNLRTGLSTTR